MHDALISELAKTGLKVISRTTVMRYRKTDKPLPQIARELDVDALVEGSVLRVGNDVRVTAQLLDSRSSSQPVSATEVTRYYARAGDVDSAMKWLERGYQQRDMMMVHVRFDPDYDALHSDPRFQYLLRRMNFPK